MSSAAAATRMVIPAALVGTNSSRKPLWVPCVGQGLPASPPSLGHTVGCSGAAESLNPCQEACLGGKAFCFLVFLFLL